MKVTVAGGLNIDITGVAASQFKMYDSNIGHITFADGGVGRNIAHNCALLGLDTAFIASAGDDAAGRGAAERLKSLGADVSGIIFNTGYATDKYLCLIDEKGEMVAAVNDMRCADLLTPEILFNMLPENYGMLAVDANLPQKTLKALSELEGPVFFEPVSAIKAAKVADFCGRFAVIKPNRYEAEVLSGVSVNDEKDIIKAGRTLIKKGCKEVYITAGSEGIYAFRDDEYIRMKPAPVKVVNATGAGDALSAGILYASVNGLDAEKTLAFALKCSEYTLQSSEAVNPLLNAEEILKTL